MSLPDSFYLALCMTILLVGSVYWVWTQIQYVQRKVNALENIVYELKTLCNARETRDEKPLPVASYPPAPPSEIGEEDADLLEETLRIEAEIPDVVNDIHEIPDIPDDIPEDTFETLENTEKEITFEKSEKEDLHPLMQEQEDDLQPGGVGSGVAPSYTSSLDSMSVKELRRLAGQKGISGAAEMKKKELIVAIRSVPIESFLE